MYKHPHKSTPRPALTYIHTLPPSSHPSSPPPKHTFLCLATGSPHLTQAQPSPSPTSRRPQTKTVAPRPSTKTSLDNVDADAVRRVLHFPPTQQRSKSGLHRDNNIPIRIFNRNQSLRPIRRPVMALGPNSGTEPSLLH
ncbi:hypothetical protein LX36DRAFT_257300 [Colletotrichum falcatum]|nr:hypothetical protein LX36DRAFT_257300 [Colletotrichum falcatum]